MRCYFLLDSLHQKKQIQKSQTIKPKTYPSKSLSDDELYELEREIQQEAELLQETITEEIDE